MLPICVIVLTFLCHLQNIQAGVLPEEMQKIEELRKQNKDLKQQCQNVRIY